MTWRVGEWIVEPSLDEIQRGGERVKLDPRTMALFVYLIDRPGQVISPDELLDRVWSDTVVAQSSVYQAVAQLRRALGDDSAEPSYIANVPRKGYRLIAPVSPGVLTTNSNRSARQSLGAVRVTYWPDTVPLEFDGFSVVRLIGEGSVAHVFLARESALERLTALKVLKSELAADALARARFEREALAAARVVHPNVAAIYRVGHRPDGIPYIAQEYIAGRTLTDDLENAPSRTTDEAKRILRSLASALKAAETKGVVHRDVNPNNVLIERESGRVVLTDFGIAGFHESGRATEKLTRVGESLGDPLYASPEQIRGEIASASSDVYSLGILGYELLLGRGPYDASIPEEIARAHVSAEPIDLIAARPDASPSLAALLKRCLEKKPAARPTADELVRQLENPEAVEPSMEGSNRWPWSRIVLTLSAVAIVLGVIVAAWIGFGEKP